MHMLIILLSLFFMSFLATLLTDTLTKYELHLNSLDILFIWKTIRSFVKAFIKIKCIPVRTDLNILFSIYV